ALPGVLEVASLKRALGADAFEDVIHQLAVAPEPVALPLRERALSGQAESEVPHRKERGRVAPVLKNLFLLLQLGQQGGRIAGHSRPKDVVMSSFDDRDRVDLDVAQMLESGQGARFSAPERLRPEQALATQGESAGLRKADLKRFRRHRPNM